MSNECKSDNNEEYLTFTEALHNYILNLKPCPKAIAADLYPPDPDNSNDPDTAYKKLMGEANPWNNRAKFGLLDAVRCAKLSGDHSIFKRIMWELGYSCMKLRSSGQADDLKDTATDVTREVGEMIGGIREVLRDGRISSKEAAGIEKETREAVEAILRELNLVRDMAERG